MIIFDDLINRHVVYLKNPVVASLLVSKIYRQAANRTSEVNKQEEYRKSERYI
jgi:hypothetical protein